MLAAQHLEDYSALLEFRPKAGRRDLRFAGAIFFPSVLGSYAFVKFGDTTGWSRFVV